MCGRYTHLYTWKQLHRLLSLTTPFEVDLKARYNVAPSQAAPVVRAATGGGREVVMMRWGLIPSWAKDAKIGFSTINARAEGLAEKPAFRSAFQRRRCLVPVSGFYEWKAVPGSKIKQPYSITFADGEIIVFAGLWESWRDPTPGADAKPIESFTVITTAANEVMSKVHDRMPVILDPADFTRWLEADRAEAAALLRPYPNARIVAVPVSTRVNSPRNDDSACLQALS